MACTHRNERWLHFSWSMCGTRPDFPAQRTLSQAKYMALFKWLTVTHRRRTLSDRWMALLAASRASAEFPSRNTGKRAQISHPSRPEGIGLYPGGPLDEV